MVLSQNVTSLHTNNSSHHWFYMCIFSREDVFFFFYLYSADQCCVYIDCVSFCIVYAVTGLLGKLDVNSKSNTVKFGGMAAACARSCVLGSICLHQSFKPLLQSSALPLSLTSEGFVPAAWDIQSFLGSFFFFSIKLLDFPPPFPLCLENLCRLKWKNFMKIKRVTVACN